jgi:hypothetical protein
MSGNGKPKSARAAALVSGLSSRSLSGDEPGGGGIRGQIKASDGKG